MGSSYLIGCKDCDFAGLVVKVVDIVENDHFRELIDFNISAIIVLLILDPSCSEFIDFCTKIVNYVLNYCFELFKSR